MNWQGRKRKQHLENVGNETKRWLKTFTEDEVHMLPKLSVSVLIVRVIMIYISE